MSIYLSNMSYLISLDYINHVYFFAFKAVFSLDCNSASRSCFNFSWHNLYWDCRLFTISGKHFYYVGIGWSDPAFVIQIPVPQQHWKAGQWHAQDWQNGFSKRNGTSLSQNQEGEKESERASDSKNDKYDQVWRERASSKCTSEPHPSAWCVRLVCS